MKKWMLTIKAMVLTLAIALAPSCGQQGGNLPEINGVKGPMFNVVDGQVLVTLKFLNMQVDAGLKLPIPKTVNSFAEFAPNAIDGGMMLTLFLDKTDLLNIDVGIGSANSLPDGRPLPGIPGGELQNSVRIDTGVKDLSFYFSKTVFGVWMPFGFDTAGISGYWNIKFSQKVVGLLGIVGNDANRDLPSGGIIFLNINALKDKNLTKLLEMSKRNPHLKY